MSNALHVVVTGASSGIGEALVREYVKAGAKVTMLARRQEKMEAIAKDVGGTTQIFAWDLSNVETCCGWIEPAEEAFGPIDILINNAGAQIVAQVIDTEPANAQRMMDLDLMVPLRLIQDILPKMVERNRGSLINISSLAGLAPTPGMFYYSAAKAGLGAASESLRGELRKTKINVLTVYPGPVDTPMARTAIEKIGDSGAVSMMAQGTTDVLAKWIRKANEKGRGRIIYPRVYGIVRHFPNLTRWAMDRFTPIPKKLPS